jgi:CcmD family protein|tara:strand:- start:3 stop:341 length:339 start_codon:yes stop_codon:yes gene_type:complete
VQRLYDMSAVPRERTTAVRRWALIALCVGCLAVLGAPTADAAQPTQQSAPDGFVPMDDVPAEEQLPAAPLLATAYIVVWVIAIGYLWTIWRRLDSVEKELADALRRVDTDGA